MRDLIDENGEIYTDDVLDIGYESEVLIIDPDQYVRFPLPRGKNNRKIF